jgi:hypothetical protein
MTQELSIMTRYPKAFKRYWQRARIKNNYPNLADTIENDLYNAWRAGVRYGSRENYHNRISGRNNRINRKGLCLSTTMK